MKIYSLIILTFLFVGCQKIATDNTLSYFPAEAIKIKELTQFKENYRCTGSYHLKKDTVISQFEIQSKYLLMIIKLKNLSKDYQLNYYSNGNPLSPGFFSSIYTSVQYVDFLLPVFDENYEIKNISLISDKEIKREINNDSIKSFRMNLNEYAIKINNDANKVIKGQLEYYGLKYMSSNILFYKVKNEIYIFIMTPLKRNIILEKNLLYNLLFPTSNNRSFPTS
jgi:hypothetical protein